MKKPIVLIIMDGFGENPSSFGNAIKAASTPNLDKFFSEYPKTSIGASGMDVGLPDGQMGNSEVGHTNIGAGRVVYQELTRITKSISDGDFFSNKTLLGAVENCKKNGSALHICGLLSDGGVHSHINHLFALLKLAKDNGLEKVYIHCVTDGRDVPPSSSKEFIKSLEEQIQNIGVGEIATVMGRYYAMDREKRFERVELAYNALVLREGVKASSAFEAVDISYKKDATDEFILPTVCSDAPGVRAGDSFVFFNFRPDRAREITRSFVDPDFDGFERKNGFFPLYYVCMTQYDASMPNVHIAFPPQSLDMPFGQVVSELGLKQLRIAEYTKYAHVTFFFNGGSETVYKGEDRVLIDSPDVPTYDMQPEMSAPKVTDELLARLDRNLYDVVIINYANCDMVGHTGVFDAAKAAVEAVDFCVGKIVDKVLSLGGVAVITADHGNADKMSEDDGTPFTAHTTNPVPFAVIGYPCKLRSSGKLADIAPTLLDIMGIEKPSQMDGNSLIL
ncbi:MAG: 2,3-bisphosphoglycerate-independent phosphoglycerate mutase [Oscillospiraceae bacterium]|nr:2,3-bisphosphoglycerate-independent phosphoglycerate mutase [Oscillospiraceae bacterium]